jgi:hypothetical protein
MLYQNIFEIFRGFDLDIYSMILKDILKIHTNTLRYICKIYIIKQFSYIKSKIQHIA